MHLSGPPWTSGDLLGIRAASTIACCDSLVLCFLKKAMQQPLFAPHQTPHQPPSVDLSGPLGTSGDLLPSKGGLEKIAFFGGGASRNARQHLPVHISGPLWTSGDLWGPPSQQGGPRTNRAFWRMRQQKRSATPCALPTCALPTTLNKWSTTHRALGK